MNLLNLSIKDAIQYVLTTKKPYWFNNCILRSARGKICIDQNNKLKYLKPENAIEYLNKYFEF